MFTMLEPHGSAFPLAMKYIYYIDQLSNLLLIPNKEVFKKYTLMAHT